MGKGYFLYKHTNKINGKTYIGITNNLKRRWRYDGIEYKPKKDENSNRTFWNAIKKYGWDNFKHEVLLENLTFENACKLEKEYIKKYNSTSHDHGYNISPGGNGGLIYKVHPRGMLGKHQTEYEIKTHIKLMKDPKKNPMENGTVIWGVTYPHPRGMKGHHQTQKQKMIASSMAGLKHPNHKALTVYKPNGAIEHFDCASDCYKKYKFYKMWELLKTGEPYKLPSNNIPNREKCSKLNGFVFRYDNRKYRDNLLEYAKANKRRNA